MRSSSVCVSSHAMESVSELASPAVDVGVDGTGVWEPLRGVGVMGFGELSAWVREGEVVDLGFVSFLASFLRGLGDSRGVSLMESETGGVGSCFRLATTSEKDLEGAGGEPQIDILDEGAEAASPSEAGRPAPAAPGAPDEGLAEPPTGRDVDACPAVPGLDSPGAPPEGEEGSEVGPPD